MAGLDHRDNLIISVLHSYWQSGNEGVQDFTFASMCLIQGAVDLNPIYTILAFELFYNQHRCKNNFLNKD